MLDASELEQTRSTNNAWRGRHVRGAGVGGPCTVTAGGVV